MVECVHISEGCMHTCQRQLLPEHLLGSCLYRRVPCPRGKCEESIPFKNIAEHSHGEDDADAHLIRQVRPYFSWFVPRSTPVVLPRPLSQKNLLTVMHLREYRHDSAHV